MSFLKFIYSEKATKFCEIFTLFLSYVVPVKSKVKILQNFAALSEYMNFTFALFWGHYENEFNLCSGKFRMNLKILWDDLDDYGMSLIKIG